MKPFVVPQQVQIRTAWPSEPRDFTPWIADRLEMLDILGIGRLSLVATEYRIPETNRALDVLAEIADGRRVAIENQFGVGDHDHLTRLLAYGVGLQAAEGGISAAVLIAEDHLPEFVAIVDYLNRAAERLGDQGIPIFLVSVSVEEVGEYWVPRFSIVSRPNEWRAAASAASDQFLGSVDEFLDRLPVDSRAAVAALVDAWAARPGTRIDHRAKNAVAFYVPNSAMSSGATAVFVVYGNAMLAINPGYLAGSPPFDQPEAMDELLAEIQRLFPEHTTGPKRYSCNGPFTSAAPVLALADWLAERGVGD